MVLRGVMVCARNESVDCSRETTIPRLARLVQPGHPRICVPFLILGHQGKEAEQVSEIDPLAQSTLLAQTPFGSRTPCQGFIGKV